MDLGSLKELVEDEVTNCNRHDLVYRRRRGTDNEGGDYELYLTALYAIKLALDDDIQNAIIGSNFDGYGAFDDIVITVLRKDGSIKFYVVQVKHKLNPQSAINFINKKNGDFSLEKYKESYYKDIIPKMSLDHRDEGLTDVTCCLFTNAAIPDNKNKIIMDNRTRLTCKAIYHSNSDFLNTTSQGYYTFEMDMKQPEFKSFLNTYLFWGGCQRDYDDIMKRFKVQVTQVSEIGKCFGGELKNAIETDELNFDNILDGVNESVRNSFKKVNADLLTKILNDLTNYFHMLYERARSFYDQYPIECDEYSRFFQRFRFYGSQLSCGEVLEAIASRIEESLGKFKANVVADFVKYIQENCQHCLLLTKQQIKKKLLQLMLPLSVSDEDLELRFQAFRTVTDLNHPNQKLMVSKHIKVAAQGREEVALCDIVDSDSCQKLKPEFLLKHMGGVVQAGKKLELKCEDYIKRKFNKILFHMNMLHFRVGLVYILGISGSTYLLDDLRKQVNVIDLMNGEDFPNNVSFNQESYAVLIPNNTNADTQAETLMRLVIAKVHSVYYLKQSGTHFLEWKGSWEGVIFEKRSDDRYVPLTSSSCNSNFGSDCVKEKDILQYYRSTINIISAEPGMGKSTILDSLIQHCPSNKWVLKLSLNEWNDDLCDNFQEILSDPLQYIFDKSEGSCIDEFTKELFQYMKSKGAVMVFIDAFDEISPRYTSNVLKLIGKLEQLKIRTWVFTRPNLRNCLESKFGVAAICMRPLSEDEIRDNLLKKIKNNKPTLRRFLQKMIDFVRIPLHLNMFATVLLNDSLNCDDLQEIDLYEIFITTKCNIYYKKLNINMKQNLIPSIIPSIQDLIEDHQMLAQVLMYGVNFLVKKKIATPSKINQLLSKIKEHKNHVGLVSSVVGSVPIFCHKSFAEYLTAKWLSSNINHPAFKSMYQRLLEEDFEIVCDLFNKLVTRRYPLHAATVAGNLTLVQDLCKKIDLVLYDDLKRTPLHWAMSQVDKLSRRGRDYEEFEIVCKITNEICERFSSSKSFLKQRDLLGWQWHEMNFMNFRAELFYSSCYWGCKAIMLMYIELYKKKWMRDFYFDMALSHAIKGGQIDCIKLLLEQAFKSVPLKEKISRVNIESFISRQFESFISRQFESFISGRFASSKLMDLVTFFVVNEEPYNSDILLDFVAKFGYFDDIKRSNFGYVCDIKFPELLKNVETKFIQNCINNLESLEKHFGLHQASIRENFNSFDRETMILKIMLSGNVNLNPLGKFIPLHRAVKEKNMGLITFLIETGADVNQVDCDGNTALFSFYESSFGSSSTACSSEADKKDKLNVMKLLIRNGADVTVKNLEGKSCFGLAVEMTDWKIVKVFIKCGVYIDYRDNDNEFTALHKAIKARQPNNVKFFLSKGANVNTKVDEQTSLNLAVNKSPVCWEVVKLLVESGANVNRRRNSSDYTALHCAVQENRIDMVDYLVNKQADVTIKASPSQLTPLELACQLQYLTFRTTKSKACNFNILKLLVKNGAKVNTEYLHYIISNNDVDFVKLVIDSGLSTVD